MTKQELKDNIQNLSELKPQSKKLIKSNSRQRQINKIRCPKGYTECDLVNCQLVMICNAIN